MNKSSNVIDLTDALKKQKRKAKGELERPDGLSTVVDMSVRRNEILNQERRQVKRTILSEFIGACIVIPDRGLQKVALFDVSDNGLSFDLEFTDGCISPGEEVAMRVYMNQFTYFPFVVSISNVRSIDDEGVFRHGGEFIKGTVNDLALHHFVKFIENVSASLHTDNGDVMVSKIKT